MRIVHVLNNRVTEIVPEYALPVLDWYGPEFASHCIEAPDQVQPNWKYNPVTGTFYEPTDEEELTLESLKAENKLLKSQNIRVYLSGQNLFYLANIDGIDPEVTSNSGIQYPTTRLISLGFNIKF